MYVCVFVCVCVCVIVEFRCIDTLFPLLCTFVSNAPALTLLGLRRRECAFRFEETQSNIVIMFCGANQSINRNIFKPLSNIVACGNCDYSLLCTIFKFTGMLWSWNIFSKYSLIKTICQRCRQLDHMTGSVSCIISFYQITSRLQLHRFFGGWYLRLEVFIPATISRKGHATTFMTSSIDLTYILNNVSTWNHVS